MSKTRKEIIEHLMRLQALLHRYQMHSFMNFGPWGNPQRGQGRVLSILKLKPEISQKELTYLLDMSKQALAELLNKLEKNGFIQREPSSEDRRSVNIKLTEAGAAAADEMDDTPPGLMKLFDCLNDEELSNLNEYLERILDRAKEVQFTGYDEDARRQMMDRFGRRFPHGWGGRHDDDDERGGR